MKPPEPELRQTEPAGMSLRELGEYASGYIQDLTRETPAPRTTKFERDESGKLLIPEGADPHRYQELWRAQEGPSIGRDEMGEPIRSPDWAGIKTGGFSRMRDTREPQPRGLIERGNIDVSRRPAIRNPDASVSTVRSLSFEENGEEVLIPTVVQGRVVSDDEAIRHYQKTGQHLGKFKTPAAATAYAEDLHEREATRIQRASRLQAPIISRDPADPAVREGFYEALRKRFPDRAPTEQEQAQVAAKYLAGNESTRTVSPELVDELLNTDESGKRKPKKKQLSRRALEMATRKETIL